MTNKFLKSHVILTILASIGIGLVYNSSQLIEFFIGAALAGFNITLIIWICERMIYKKGFALTLLAGIGKYLVLLTVFAAAMMSGWTPSGFFYTWCAQYTTFTRTICFSIERGNSWSTLTGHN